MREPDFLNVDGSTPFDLNDRKLVFLQGTDSDVDDAASLHNNVIKGLQDKPVILYDAFISKWNLENQHDRPDSSTFIAQVEVLENSDLAVLCLPHGTENSITLAWLGMAGALGVQTIVYCPDDFHRKGNVVIGCDYTGFTVVNSEEELVNKARAWIMHRDLQRRNRVVEPKRFCNWIQVHQKGREKNKGYSPPPNAHPEFVIATAPNLPKEVEFKKTVVLFFAGSIKMDKARLWQGPLASRLSGRRVTVMNPRRPDWNRDWKQDANSPQFAEQVKWEIVGLYQSQVIPMCFDGDTNSPITLYEWGWNIKSGKMILNCPETFWAYPFLAIMCSRYGIPLVHTDDQFYETISARLDALGVESVKEK